VLRFDGEPERSEGVCDRCGRPYGLVKSFVLDDDSAHAVCFVALHRHDGQREAWFDVIFGTWEDEATDHVTFGCRVGPIEGQVEPAATLVAAGVPYRDTRLFGRKLTREEALQHPLVGDFWRIVDFVLVNDPNVEKHIYHIHE
jgi:hypothetical protein